MMETPAKPNRWRWLVLVAHCCLTVAAILEFRARNVVDSRFVGVWQVGGVSESSAQFETGQLRLSSTGFGGMTPKCPLLTFWPQSFPWAISGEKLCIGEKSRSQLWWIVDNALATLRSRSRHYAGSHEFDIVETGVDRIVLRRTALTSDQHRDFELKRVPE